MRLTYRLIKRLQASVEHSFVGGSYLTPIALRYDDQDVSRYTVDKTCIFFSFPYFQIADSAFRNHKYRSDGHPPRTVLQTRYRLNRTTDRDQYQCIRRLDNATIDKCIEPKRQGAEAKAHTELLVFIPQLWGLIIGLGKAFVPELLTKMADGRRQIDHLWFSR